MLKLVISAVVGAAVWATAVAEGAKPKTELLGTVEFASFDEVQQKMADLGATVNNPVVPMLVMPSLQNFLNENCGKFRKDAPMTFYCYAQMEALRKAMSDSSDEVDVEDAIDPVFVYPTAEDHTAFMASHPEAQKARSSLTTTPWWSFRPTAALARLPKTWKRPSARLAQSRRLPRSVLSCAWMLRSPPSR